MGIVALAAAGGVLIALLIALWALLGLRRVRADQRLVVGEMGEQDLVAHAAAIQRRMEHLAEGVEETSSALFSRMESAEVRLDGSICKTAVVRYDAFNETSGRQSSTVALLDDRDNGVIISAILQREQARVYAKAVTEGRSELELSPEELEAIRRAREQAGPSGAEDARE